MQSRNTLIALAAALMMASAVSARTPAEPRNAIDPALLSDEEIALLVDRGCLPATFLPAVQHGWLTGLPAVQVPAPRQLPAVQ